MLSHCCLRNFVFWTREFGDQTCHIDFAFLLSRQIRANAEQKIVMDQTIAISCVERFANDVFVAENET